MKTEMTKAKVTTIPPRIKAFLTKLDRCDRCGAAARSRVVLHSGAELLFCGHHTSLFEPALDQQLATIYHD